MGRRDSPAHKPRKAGAAKVVVGCITGWSRFESRGPTRFDAGGLFRHPFVPPHPLTRRIQNQMNHAKTERAG